MRTARRFTVSRGGAGSALMQTPPQKADLPTLCQQTNTCENITFPILRMRAVISETQRRIQDFPEEVAPTPKGHVNLFFLPKFHQKLHEYEDNCINVRQETYCTMSSFAKVTVCWP